MSSDRPELLPTRASLLQRLKNWDDNASWKDFFNTYWALIYGVARKASLNDAEAQDVVQETILCVAQKMPGFDYDPKVGSFKGWLMRLTHWRITDQFRKKQYEKGGKRYAREESLDAALLQNHAELSTGAFESFWEEEWQKHLLHTAMEKVKERTTPRLFQMFHLYAVKNMPVTAVAKKLGVKPATVYFAKFKVGSELKKQIRLLRDMMD